MLKNVTLEMSLKPFKQMDEAYIRKTARFAFEQWKPLCEQADAASIMLWVGDGSEILDYKGNMEQEFEWGCYAGGANTTIRPYNPKRDPNCVGLHSRYYNYIENPPKVTYNILKNIIRILKEEGKRVLGEDKIIRVGETFDPGPEFANSTFKYKRHREICLSSTGGESNFICSYARLHADSEHYAGFPNGIPEGTPLGTFVGRQAQHMLTDCGFDFLWLSNGFGFGRDTWSATGAIFDGKEFNFKELNEVRKVVFEFWQLFRAECPDIRIETRGTNMSVGIDYSKDGVPLYDMYRGGFNFLPPPNSPWAALDGDFGLELMGYLSRIAELPDDEQYLFRFYVHDPWWINSPWYDRYQGQPHDIYMPLSCARINGKGEISKPTHLNLLSIDTTFGEFPKQCAYEAIPHLLKGLKDAPDEAAPVIWVYPFREYCTSTDPVYLSSMFSGDWYVRGAMNSGFPLSMVISTDNFLKTDTGMFAKSVLFTPVPLAGTEFESKIIDYVNHSGKVIFYGTLENASEQLKDIIGVKTIDGGIGGDLPLTVDGKERGLFRHEPLICAGKINTVAEGDTKIIANTDKYALATVKSNCAWLRTSLSSDFKKGQRLLVPQDDAKFFTSETLALKALASLGWSIDYEKEAGQRPPVIIWSRSDNALMFSTFMPSTTVKMKFKTPMGAPVLIGYETKIENGFSTYHFPKAEHKECRVFVEMKDGIVGVHEQPPVSMPIRRRVVVSGLRDATVRFFAEEYCKDKFEVVLNGLIDEYTLSDPIEGEFHCDENGSYFEARHVTGSIQFGMPRPGFKILPIPDDVHAIASSEVPNYL